MDNFVNSAQREQDLQANDGYRLKYAGFWVRFWAYIIDLLVVSAISGIIVSPIFRAAHWEMSKPIFLVFSPYKVVLLIVFLLYFALMTRFSGQTIGKMIIGIRVVSKEGTDLSWSAIIFREVIGRFISKLLWLPYLFTAVMPKKEALHDTFADTVVVFENVYEKEREVFIFQAPDKEQLQGEQTV